MWRKHEFKAILAGWQPIIGRETVTAAHSRDVPSRRDAERDGRMSGLANREPAFGFAVNDDIACPIAWKFAPKGVDVMRDRRAEFVDQSPSVPPDEVRLSSRRFHLAGTQGIALSLVVSQPCDPLVCHTSPSVMLPPPTEASPGTPGTFVQRSIHESVEISSADTDPSLQV